ncbi:hypothetical protein QJS10_CPA03g01351 [Acorus calamus]|uniref:Uncharacterized protein n=1 Tax=Acorus calamus TaxID=4465 RepID=A0AAV9F8A1_ACOCL|nr:hypothetical protein QJS10_CPA03g01351 [Acorus calamus]
MADLCSQAVAVSNLGKWKTATQMTALTILLVSRDSSKGRIAAFRGKEAWLELGVCYFSHLYNTCTKDGN